MGKKLHPLLAEIAVQIDQNIKLILPNSGNRRRVAQASDLDHLLDRGIDAAANFAAIIPAIVDRINFKP